MTKIGDPAKIVKILNNQFISVFEKDNGEKPKLNREKIRLTGET